ncbi:MAG: sigma 54-interacting transcriptional regulator [Labilithrix sp.]|nr:sigma 54-interacting transcriptional regulator [Labilithrix sp.]
MALAAPLALVSASSTRAFVDFDERIVSAQAGVVVVRASSEVHAPLVAHASRRLRTSGFVPVDAAVRSGAPLFREVAMHLGLPAVPLEPSACADAIGEAASAQRAAIVVPLPADGTWDRAVATELAKNARLLLVFVTDGVPPAFADTSSVFDVVAELGATDKLRWLSAIAEEAQSDLPAVDLRSLEAWWAKARRVVPAATPAFEELDAVTREVLTCVALAGRSLPISDLARLVSGDVAAAVDELVASGLASVTASVVSASPSAELGDLESAASDESRRAVARCLAGSGFNPDPWAFARAAELFVLAGAFDEADAAVSSALKAGGDPQVSAEIATRWFDVVAPIEGAGGLELRMKAAQRSLLLGEAADAQRWCESAAALDPTDATISLLMGRALMQLGDLVAARVCLAKAETNAATGDAELAARVAAERAEVSYLGGELEQAAGHAMRAADIAVTPRTRLAARGTLGKILLARGSWELADEHFAEDALTASSTGEITAELRARLNRAIALLSKGRLDEARTLLDRVLADGTRLQEERARAYALSNLGLVAYRQHDYGAALQYWEQTVNFPQALRGRLATALTIGNLADLRLRLGLVDHAEHAIAFGKKLLSGSAPPRCSALFKWVSAQIALARGNTDLARREVEGALVDAQASGERDYLESAHIVAARVALEDGDLARVGLALEHAGQIAKSPRAQAEIAIVRAAHLRAMGQPALDSANEALQVARKSGEEDLLSEIHSLLATLHRDAGDLLAAQAHCCRAIAVRDQVAGGLPPDIRAAFLAKPETVALSRLQSSLAHETDAEEEAPRTQRVVARSESNPSREMVGDDPAIRSLAIAIKKVAKSNSTVLIRGESGTGKELVADALHRASDRAAGPLVSVNCAALVETLLLSELFGHEKGAFTGASARRRGRFEMAEGGTLFLDEIGDISPRTQVALLRVLQEKTFERVGGTTPIRANVRVVCATHRDLRAMVERGEFREDLYYRLRGITLEVPALRARLGDLPKIADHLLTRIAVERNEEPKQLSSDAVELFNRHRWPGNIRELENVLRAVSLFADGTVITATDVIDNVDDLRAIAQAGPGPTSQGPVSLRSASVLSPPSVREPSSSASSVDADDDEGDGLLPEDEANATAVAYAQVRQGAVSLSDIKRQIERDCIARALAETKGNITRAAALLGMKRPRLSQLVKQYSLSAAPSEGNS